MKSIISLSAALLAMSIVNSFQENRHATTVSKSERSALFGTCLQMTENSTKPYCYSGCISGGCGCKEAPETEDGVYTQSNAIRCTTKEECTDVFTHQNTVCSGY